jgi:hypothetical protein
MIPPYDREKKENSSAGFHTVVSKIPTTSGKIMRAEPEKFSEHEFYLYILWLESEIDRCLQYDLPFEHLELELCKMNERLKKNTHKENTPRIPNKQLSIE